ncbi:MAG: GIY-YIG nuclease family protein [Chloroflexi bacterium]|nr:GIY-YIG nuclease family protein [Chloroflexota bacterium]
MTAVYILRSGDSGRYYIGCAQDLDIRLKQHNSGANRSTRGRGPWTLVYHEWFTSLAQARARERQLKSWKNPYYLEQKLGIGTNRV